MSEKKGKKRVVSGKRPTGAVHFGHYHGAIRNWVELQDKYDCFYCSVDWHALTSDYEDPSRIHKNIRDNILDWLACGLDPHKCTIFVQSAVKETAEIFLLLSMITPVSWLERNPTYKEQLQQIKDKDLSNLGFLAYPVLQTADILAYQGECVPVGEDQLPHLELAREMTRRFNRIYRKHFPEPQPLLTEAPILPGVDGRKMSNSYHNEILISDSEEVIRQKVLTMMTDPARKTRKDPGEPMKCPLFSLHKIYSPGAVQEKVLVGCRTAGIGCIECKGFVLEYILPWIRPIHEKRQLYVGKPKLLEEIIEEGNKKARAVAQLTLGEMREALKL